MTIQGHRINIYYMNSMDANPDLMNEPRQLVVTTKFVYWVCTRGGGAALKMAPVTSGIKGLCLANQHMSHVIPIIQSAPTDPGIVLDDLVI